jgi:hypothetical protein
VLADALRLDTDARAELAAELLASLDGPADADAEAAWDAEIERRTNACCVTGLPERQLNRATGTVRSRRS